MYKLNEIDGTMFTGGTTRLKKAVKLFFVHAVNTLIIGFSVLCFNLTPMYALALLFAPSEKKP